MITRRMLFATVAAVVLALLTPGGPSSAADGPVDWISTDGALVNKLGGVHVYGSVSCAGTAQTLKGSSFWYESEDGWREVPVDADATINLFVNPDNYIVSQPAGRKQMIQVEHGSSRMSPCYVETTTDQNGTPWEELGVECSADGTSCGWETDRYAYDASLWGPLFDYSSDGKFKAGDLNVNVSAYGVLIIIVPDEGGWEYYFINGMVDIFGQQVVRAQMYR